MYVHAFYEMKPSFRSPFAEDDLELEELPEPEPETEAEAALRALYLDKTLPTSPRYVDPGVGFREVRGRGRGLVAVSPLALGQRLLVSNPLGGVVFCEEGNTPENEELADYIKTRCGKVE